MILLSIPQTYPMTSIIIWNSSNSDLEIFWHHGWSNSEYNHFCSAKSFKQHYFISMNDNRGLISGLKCSFCRFHSPVNSGRGWTWTLTLGIMRWVLRKWLNFILFKLVFPVMGGQSVHAIIPNLPSHPNNLTLFQWTQLGFDIGFKIFFL
jgi:hypothetical protein